MPRSPSRPDTADDRALELPRVLGSLRGKAPGPTLLCVGGLHGNEPAGALALQRLLPRLAAESVEVRGEVVGLTGNRNALASRRRYLTVDLNRAWSEVNVDRIRAASGGLSDEDAELAELDREITAIMSRARGQVFVLDLHTTSGAGLPFISMDDTLPNRRFAAEIPATHVLGLEEELAGTMLNHLTDRGCIGIGFEAGQHDDPASIERAEATVWIALESAGVLPRGTRPEPAAARGALRAVRGDVPRVVEVLYRHAVDLQDGFAMDPGFVSFQRVREGQRLASHASGPVHAPRDGLLLMPLYQRQGDDGFFVIQAVNPIWLHLSAWLRRLRFDRLVPWLPGVRRHPERERAVIVDQRRARWLAREVLHLLGYKRIGIEGPNLVMSRRHDGG